MREYETKQSLEVETAGKALQYAILQYVNWIPSQLFVNHSSKRKNKNFNVVPLLVSCS